MIAATGPGRRCRAGWFGRALTRQKGAWARKPLGRASEEQSRASTVRLIRRKIRRREENMSSGNIAPESNKAGMDNDPIAKTKELIEHTRREILRLQEDIQSARTTIDRSQGLLSRAGPPSQRR